MIQRLMILKTGTETLRMTIQSHFKINFCTFKLIIPLFIARERDKDGHLNLLHTYIHTYILLSIEYILLST